MKYRLFFFIMISMLFCSANSANQNDLGTEYTRTSTKTENTEIEFDSDFLAALDQELESYVPKPVPKLSPISIMARKIGIALFMRYVSLKEFVRKNIINF